MCGSAMLLLRICPEHMSQLQRNRVENNTITNMETSTITIVNSAGAVTSPGIFIEIYLFSVGLDTSLIIS